MLSRRSSAADLSPQDVEVIRSLAEQRNVALSDRPGETPEDLFVSLQHAKTFAD